MRRIEQEHYFCHDCGKEVKTRRQEFIGGKLLVYKDEKLGKITVVKCDECYLKMPALTKFRECEVYSRIVGYLRPVQQWNKGKRAEFKDRKEFKNQ